MRKPYDDTTIRQAVSLYQDGLSYNEISIRMSIPQSTIWRWINAEGLVRNPESHWSVSECQLLSTMWPSSCKRDILIEFPSRTWDAIKYKASELGIRRDVYFSSIKKAVLDFSIVDTEAKAYILGFIMADGSVRSGKKGSLSLKISLAKEDKGHLEKIRDLLCPAASIKPYPKKNPSHQDSVEFCVNDTKFCRDLSRWGVTPNKTKVVKPPTNLSESLISHFIRGLFDGDGSFWYTGGKPYASVDGTLDMMEWINEVFRNHFKHGCKTYKGHGTRCVRYGKRTAIEFARYLYNGANIYMERKYDKMRELL